MNELKTTNRKLIEAYILIFFDAGNRSDMTNLGMLCLLQILQNSTSSYHTSMQMIDTKALQVLDIKVAQQLLLRGLLCEHPVIKLESKVF